MVIESLNLRRSSGCVRKFGLFACALLALAGAADQAKAQTFAPIPALSFVKPYTGADPLPQTLTVASVGAGFNFTYTSSTSSGGSWLSVSVTSQCAYGYLCSTPHTITVSANPSVTLVTGNYSGQLVLTSQNSAVTLTVPISLTIAPRAGPFFDDLPGQVSFSLKTNGTSITSQDIQVRNGGDATLAWSLSASTSDGNNWLNVSATSGTAPTRVTIGIAVTNLPNGGIVPGTFVGQLAFQSSYGDVTIPVSVVVGDSVLSQVNAISFMKVLNGANPLPQTLTVPSTGAGLHFQYASSTATGGDWLSVSVTTQCAYGYSCSTPYTLTVSVNPAATLPAGSYTGQIVLSTTDGSTAMTVPVILTIAPTGGTFFDNLPGQIGFSLKTGGTGLPTQDIHIRNGGSGTLPWTLTTSTSDTSNWLTVSATSGTAPSTVTVGISVSNLPNSGLVAGTFIGQIVFHSAFGDVTIPVSVVVGDSVLSQVNAISFMKVFNGANPLPQTLTVPSTGAGLHFQYASSTATGGDWLSVSVTTQCAYGYSCSTPYTLTVSVNPAATLPAGSYTGQIVLSTTDGSTAMTVPVILTIAPTGGTFFDNLPGQIGFSLKTGGTGLPTQDIHIRNGGSGTLPWTLTTSTSDTSNWLTVSATSGTAPSTVTVGISVSNLPNSGLVAGTFIGQIVFHSAFGDVTIPVSVLVGDSVLSQVNAISFMKVFNGANPLPQTLTVPSTGAGLHFQYASSTATGGNWLSVSVTTQCAYGYSCSTPYTLTVSVNPAATLPAGSYTGQIVLSTTDGSTAMTVPVILTIAPTGGTFFDTLPGQISFSIPTGATSVSTQDIQIRNGGSGTLPWTLTTSTSDTSNWLTVSATSGTAPFTVTVGVDLSHLPNNGIVPGRFIGELVVRGAGGSISIPVSLSVGTAFVQLSDVTFSKAFGGPNPLPQTLNITSTDLDFKFTVSSSTANGGNWLTVSNVNTCPYGYLCSTPHSITLSVNPSTTLSNGTYLGQIVVTSGDASMAMTIPVTLQVGPPPPPPNGVPLSFYSLAPCRVVDTRRANDAFGGPIMSAGQTREFDITNSTCGIPQAATAYSLNVTVVPSGPLGFLTAFPAGQSRPLASTLNSDGRVKANAAIVPAGTNQGIDIFVTDQTHVIIDIDGYFLPATAIPASAELQFYELAPCRIVDTRKSPAPLAGPSLSALTSRTFPVLSSSCGIPSTARAYSLNVTALPHGGLNFLTSFPTGTTRPVASTLNASTGTPTANAAIVPSGASGSIDVFVTNDTDVLIDTNGYFAARGTGGLSLHTSPPCRIEDTRQPSGTSPKSGTTTVPVSTSSCQVPAGAQAYVMNATVVPPGAPLGWLTLWPDGAPQPVASTLNAFDGAVTSNMAIVPTTNGNIQTFAENPTYVILDIMAYFAP